MEQGLGAIPDWAAQIVNISIRCVPPCGHYTFPKAYLETVSAIGTECPQSFLHTCFTVDADRKRAMMDYCLCLDGWLAGANPDAVSGELTVIGHRKADWRSVCRALWEILGTHTALKDLLVERILLQTRWWIKSSVWDDDRADIFCRDEYLGDFAETGCLATDNGNPHLPAPAFRLQASPRIQQMDAMLQDICPDWPWFRNLIVDGSWPCAPKAIRYLERLLWSVGKERPAVTLPSYPMAAGDEVSNSLQAEDSCPDHYKSAKWWDGFLNALDAWWQDQSAAGDTADAVFRQLAARTDVKRWLVRLYAHRLRLLARHANLGRLVGRQPGRCWGTKHLETDECDPLADT